MEENLLYEQAEEPIVYHVMVEPNPSSDRCNIHGDYEFHINTMNFSIVDKKTKKPQYIWPFRYVRRYGATDDTLQFEAGRKCPSGEGLFSFKSAATKAEEMLTVIQEKFAAIKKRDGDFKGSAQANDKPKRPPIPSRPKIDISYCNLNAAKVAPSSVNSLIAKNRPLLQQSDQESDQYAEIGTQIKRSADTQGQCDVYEIVQ